MGVKKPGYEVVTRPAGGIQIIPALCDDGLVHVFGLIDDVADNRPACGVPLSFGKPPLGSESMCVACAGRAEAWAMGGSLTEGRGAAS